MQSDTAIATKRQPSLQALRSGLGPAVCRYTPTPNTRHVRPAVAFTLIELLVAISVLSLMMALATRIFFDAQAGVQRGLQTSQIIAESRSVSQPLARDMREMYVFESKYSSNTPGFLSIVQQEFEAANVNDPTAKPAVLFPRPLEPDVGTDGWLPYIDYNGNGMQDTTAGYFEPAALRSDQITFFRDAAGLEPLTPGSDAQYDSLARARHARVWYGHVSPVIDTDNDPTSFEPSLNPGDDGYDLASQLVLGRQALLLIENDDATIYPNGRPGTTADGPGANNRIPGFGGSVRAALYGGLHDVYDLQKYTVDSIGLYDDTGVVPAVPGEIALFRTPTHDIPVSASSSLFGRETTTPGGGLTTGDYAEQALDWMFARNGQRLQAQTFLENNFDAGIFTADQIAQLHAAFAPHIADFAIEFAADWIDTDPQDRDGDGDYLEADGMPDLEPDRDGAGNIIWYTAAFYANPDDAGMNISQPNTWVPSANTNDYDGVGNVNAILPITYPVPIDIASFDGTPNRNLITNRFAYEFNGNTNAVSAYDENSQNVVFVWSHTGDDLATDIDDSSTPLVREDVVEGAGKYWPYLIRFRFRLMDGKGEFRTIQTNAALGEDYSEVGRWFEQIVPVARPGNDL